MRARPVVNSWDVFDTLLTRFIPEPAFVFEHVERGHPGFKTARLGAQAALDKIGRPYVIYDIYAQMVESGFDSAAAKRLLAEELAVERTLMLPVKKAVMQVAPQDLIISDMYLTGEQISALLADVCDLHGHTPVVRSNWGKHSGTIWPKLLKQYVIRTHYGDNPVADASVPQKFGIQTVLLRDIDYSEWETKLVQSGFGQLARIQRETRLRCLTPDAGLFENMAAGPYLTLLLAFASQLIFTFGDAQTFGFLSRDCDDLARVFRAIHPAARSFNADISRRLAYGGGADEIFQQILPPGCVLVDMVSTGRSLSNLFARIGTSGRAFTTLIFLDHLLKPQESSNFFGKFLYKSSQFGGNHYPLELLLQSTYPPVTDLNYDAPSGGLIRSYGTADLLPAEAKMIAAKAEIVTLFLRGIRLRGLAPLTEPQSTDLLRLSLEAIFAGNLQAGLFPSFIAQEKFAGF
jgi:hypothetical protein